MPTYCFKCDCGHAEELSASMADAPTHLRCRVCAEQMSRDFQAELPQHLRGDMEYRSDIGLSVAPEQAASTERMWQEYGHNVTFDRGTGAAVFKSRSDRNKFLKANNFFDRSAGYGDWAGSNSGRK